MMLLYFLVMAIDFRQHFFVDEIKKQFVNCQPKFVISDADQVGKMLEIAKQVPSIQVISADF